MTLYTGVNGTGELKVGDGTALVKIIGVNEEVDASGNKTISYLTQTTFNNNATPEVKVYNAKAFENTPTLTNSNNFYTYDNGNFRTVPTRDDIVDALVEKAAYEGKDITRDEAIREFNDYQGSKDIGNYTEIYDKIKEDIKKVDPNAYYLKSEGYQTLHQSGVTGENPNGYLSSDIRDNHDKFMYATNTTRTGGIRTTARSTDVAKYDGNGNLIGAKDGKEEGIKKDKDGNITSVNGITKEVTLASAVTLSGFNDDTRGLKFSDSSKYLAGMDRRLWSVDDTTNLTKAEWMDIYASSGQYNSTDLSKMFNAYKSIGWQKQGSSNGKKLFKGTNLEKIYNKVKDINADTIRADYESRLQNYKEQWAAKHAEIEGWKGAASEQWQKDIFEEVQGLFDKEIEHLEGEMKEAVRAFEAFKRLAELLSKLEIQLEEAEQKSQEAATAVKNHKENEPKPKEDIVWDYDERGYRTGSHKVVRAEWNTWNDNLTKLLEASRKADEELEKKQKMYNNVAESTEKQYNKWSSYDQSMTSFGDYFSGGSRSNWLDNAQSILNHYDDGDYGKGIKSDFEDFSRFPVLDALSKYNVGDDITFDDAHDELYRVTGEFDPLTGSIVIQHVGANGEVDGEPVTIWDQREIWPVGGSLHKPKGGGDVDTPTPPTIAPTTPKPKPTTPPPGGNPTSPPPGGNPTSPPPGASPTTPPIGTTPGTLPGTTPVPGVPVTTTPGTSPNIPGIVPSTDPTYFAPHTGLDAVYTVNGNGDTKQSNSSIGALAGLAMGAAGLGLTGLIGDKDKKEDEDKKEENIESEKEEKKEETIQNDSIESNNNQQEPEIKEFNNILEQK